MGFDTPPLGAGKNLFDADSWPRNEETISIGKIGCRNQKIDVFVNPRAESFLESQGYSKPQIVLTLKANQSHENSHLNDANIFAPKFCQTQANGTAILMRPDLVPLTEIPAYMEEIATLTENFTKMPGDSKTARDVMDGLVQIDAILEKRKSEGVNVKGVFEERKQKYKLPLSLHLGPINDPVSKFYKFREEFLTGKLPKQQMLRYKALGENLYRLTLELNKR